MIGEERALFHYGTLHKSGRYPWGSGDNPQQRNKKFLAYVQDLEKQGLTQTEIAKGLGISRVQLQANKSIAKAEKKAADIAEATRLAESGMSNVAIGDQMGINESSVRALREASTKAKNEATYAITDMLKSKVDEKGMIDVGIGVERHLGISKEKLNVSVAMLEEQGYNVYKFQHPQMMTDKMTNYKVLAKPDIPYSDVYKHPENIHLIQEFSTDGGRSSFSIQDPLVINSKRVDIRYGPDGGKDMDGVIQIRRGVDDLSMGNSKYAQVRIAVDGTHYIKGMAIYADDLPHGVDIRFNTNKSDTGNKLDALKPMSADRDNPFGAIVRQQISVDAKGNKTVTSGLNIVNEEGDWDKWSKNISSQVLSKQSPVLAKQQLGLKFDAKRAELDEIMALTNPAVKRKLLQGMADDLDSSAIHLKAAALPRQRTQVILPLTKIKEDEIYAPNFKNGEKVALIRYPHGGIFEIPELTVNNRQRSAIDHIKGAIDAVGIHPKVADQLSGADFDGDTVLVIPNNKKSIKHDKPLKQLEGFDAKTQYAAYPGMVRIKDMKNPGGTTQKLMGDISNLITDMTILEAPTHEIARAVKHSMVVIDAEKHSLNYKQSAIDNDIPALKKKYQGKSNGGAATLISLAGSQATVLERKPRSARNGGAIDPATGKKVWEYSGDSYVNKAGKTIMKKSPNSKKMAETDDANSLLSKQGKLMEHVYADHANRLKAMANEARKELYYTPPIKYEQSANRIYAPQVKSLDHKLNVALMNAPLERHAQLVAATNVAAKRQADPTMDKAQLKKLKGLALEEARNRFNAKKKRIEVTPIEWEAIQAGAITNNKLNAILTNMNDKDVKALATPKDRPVMIPSNVARAKGMLAANFTRAEIADALGVSVNTLNSSLAEGT